MQHTTDAIDLHRLHGAADKAQALLKALSNRDRLMLLCQLVGGERNVGELEASLGILQPTLSQQLGVLRRENMVATRREGKLVYYRIASPEALAVISTLYQLFCSEEPE
ncbi:metalloregulator ArsR/SmtB family transcription factor [uncultured Halopseudomonas sp.]|uniref:ArsR/SmtB family transcription factor n=1 Tax=uncultured Halopseudomonas sp. TaxID=2901193 RepID=UPI0030EC48A1|tara:strand:- start:111133 stop:111459 length:327 start_codon:yes stop_codon:yes gene_type:complete